MKPRIAVIDDLEPARQMMRRALARSCEVADYGSVEEAIAAFELSPPDAIVTDLRMPGIDGLEGLRRFRERAIGAPVIVVTAYASVETAVEAMKAGAFDYLKKPFDPEQLEVLVERAVEHGRLRRENERLRRELGAHRNIRGIVGRSPAMRRVVDVVERVAPTDLPVLIEGESGTGKDLVARAIHDLSPRASGPFLSINMSAIPDALAESELFGHERGAFSGATVARRGFFAEAEGGTLFLDEIGAAPPSLQPKLLRVLQDGEYIPVGSRQARKADARIVCATNEDLTARAKAGSFREDLYYRIRVMPVALPPLRERREDIALLVEHFVRKHAGRLGRAELAFSPDAMRAILEYPWPGNVRELENAVERALLLARGDELEVEDLPPEVREHKLGEGEGGYRRARDEWEKGYLQALLGEASGSVARAADLAGLHRSTLYEKLARHGLLSRQ